VFCDPKSLAGRKLLNIVPYALVVDCFTEDGVSRSKLSFERLPALSGGSVSSTPPSPARFPELFAIQERRGSSKSAQEETFHPSRRLPASSLFCCY
jgi:hypothetical protein